MTQSDIARLLESITLSYQAAQRALTSPAIVAPHEFIIKRLEDIAKARDELEAIVGEEDARVLVLKHIDAIEETEAEQ